MPAPQPLPEDPELHQALFDAMRVRGLRLVEMDQFVYPEPGDRHTGPAHSMVYLQVLDAQRAAVASGSYPHPLSTRSPFIGLRAIPGSPRALVMDAMACAILAANV